MKSVMLMTRCMPAWIRAHSFLAAITGHLLASRNGGDKWDTIFNWLPSIYSVQAAIINQV